LLNKYDPRFSFPSTTTCARGGYAHTAPDCIKWSATFWFQTRPISTYSATIAAIAFDEFREVLVENLRFQSYSDGTAMTASSVELASLDLCSRLGSCELGGVVSWRDSFPIKTIRANMSVKS
jgi:hypothetical protein